VGQNYPDQDREGQYPDDEKDDCKGANFLPPRRFSVTAHQDVVVVAVNQLEKFYHFVPYLGKGIRDLLLHLKDFVRESLRLVVHFQLFERPAASDLGQVEVFLALAGVLGISVAVDGLLVVSRSKRVDIVVKVDIAEVEIDVDLVGKVNRRLLVL
jgi:hypothetical protein